MLDWPAVLLTRYSFYCTATACLKLHQTAIRGPDRRQLHKRRAMADSEPSTSGGPALFTSNFLEQGGQDPALGLVVLNRPLPRVTAHLWHRASLRICADGGANRVYDELPAQLPVRPAEEVRAAYLPDLIVGDLDSIRPAVMDFYRQRGVELLDLSADQMTNDLMKSLKSIEQLRAARGLPQPFTTVALGGLGGRLDHTLANLSTLHALRGTRLVLCGDDNLVRLVPAGRSLIRPHRPLEGPSCGLVPLRGRAVASSSGLRWNLDKTEMEIGALVSTSNIMDADEIPLDSDSDLIWTVEYDDDAFGPVAD